MQVRDKGTLISGLVLQAKALEYHKHFNEGQEQFTTSIGWLNHWEKRFGVRNLNITGEKLSASVEEIATFTAKLAKLAKTVVN
jgi:hypothetical protein